MRCKAAGYVSRETCGLFPRRETLGQDAADQGGAARAERRAVEPPASRDQLLRTRDDEYRESIASIPEVSKPQYNNSAEAPHI